MPDLGNVDTSVRRSQSGRWIKSLRNTLTVRVTANSLPALRRTRGFDVCKNQVPSGAIVLQVAQ